MSQLNQSIKRAEDIFKATGILSRSIEREPNSSEREELWQDALFRNFLLVHNRSFLLPK